MSQLICKKCKQVIIEDYEDYVLKYPDENYIQCPICGEIKELK